MKRLLIAISILLILAAIGMLTLAGLYAAVFAQERKPDNPQPADCIIVLGNKVNKYGPSLSLAGRLERALELYEAGYAPNIIVCGGMGKDEPVTEASAMRDFLIGRNVDAGAIYMDEVSRNTVENLREAKRIMEENGFEDAIICTSDFHAYRSMRIAKDAGISATSAKAYTEWSTKSAARFRECLSWIKYFLGL